MPDKFVVGLFEEQFALLVVASDTHRDVRRNNYVSPIAPNQAACSLLLFLAFSVGGEGSVRLAVSAESLLKGQS